MRVFLSWSGSLSHNVALALRGWLPLVIQSVSAYVSSADINKGTRWGSDIAKELETCSYGIICITKENQDAPWVNFEAGAISKSVNDSFVSPFLLDLKKSEVQGPLRQFQSTTYEKEEVRQLMHSINIACGENALEETRLNSIFDMAWESLKGDLDKIIKEYYETKKGEVEDKATESEKDNYPVEVFEEVLDLSRSQYRLLNSPGDLIPPEYFREQLKQAMSYLTPLISSTREIDEMSVNLNRIRRSMRNVEIQYRRILDNLNSGDADNSEISEHIELIHNKYLGELMILVEKNELFISEISDGVNKKKMEMVPDFSPARDRNQRNRGAWYVKKS
ncbi:TIR domain-containing protein [Peribacillus sp. SCS-37]|uniref:TIR domain-containing protein n=1 Tax=Paraperibacillus esterisolvens TaxID=3115296 RepID=UPI00390611CE